MFAVVHQFLMVVILSTQMVHSDASHQADLICHHFILISREPNEYTKTESKFTGGEELATL